MLMAKKEIKVTATPWVVNVNDPVGVTIRAFRIADGTTATGFVCDSTKLWTVNWSRIYGVSQ